MSNPTPTTTTETKHTPGPWYVEQPYQEPGAYIACKWTTALVCKMFKAADCSAEQVEANASRIVACVNACEGIENPGEALEAFRKAASPFADLIESHDAIPSDDKGGIMVRVTTYDVRMIQQALAMLGGAK